MKKISFFAALAIIAITAQSQSVFVKRQNLVPDKIASIDSYHESDDLLHRDSTLTIYLNQTSPVTDTLYVYNISILQQCNGITKTGSRCKRTQIQNYCHQHKSINN